MTQPTDRYDVALSFAGEDRVLVRQVAAALRKHQVRVFYDEYEQATLWGKDLTEHLDTVYRKQSRLCVMFISEAYSRKAWPRHEKRSALAKALGETTDYVLPIRLGETDLPGLPPTVGYLDGRTIDAEMIAKLICEKLRSIAVFPRLPDKVRDIENMARIRTLWGRDWLGVVVGTRYLMLDGAQIRLAVSFENNNTEMLSKRTIFPVHRQKGPYVFLLQNVMINEKRDIALVDSELDSISVESTALMTLDEMYQQAIAILEAFSDEKYKQMCAFFGKLGEFGREPQASIGDFTIAKL